MHEEEEVFLEPDAEKEELSDEDPALLSNIDTEALGESWQLDISHLTPLQLQEVIEIIRAYPGDYSLKIMGKSVPLSEEGWQRLQVFIL